MFLLIHGHFVIFPNLAEFRDTAPLTRGHVYLDMPFF